MDVLHITQPHNPSIEVREKKQLKYCTTLRTISKNKEEAISEIQKKGVGHQQSNHNEEVDITNVKHRNIDKHDNESENNSKTRNDITTKTRLGAQYDRTKDSKPPTGVGKPFSIEAKGVGYMRVHSLDTNVVDADNNFDFRMTLNSSAVPITLTLGGSEDAYNFVVDKGGDVDTLINGIDNRNTALVENDTITPDWVNDGCLNDLSSPTTSSKYKDEADKTGQDSIDYTKTHKRNNSAHLFVSGTQVLNIEPAREAEEHPRSFQSDNEYKTYQSCDDNTTIASFFPDVETFKTRDFRGPVTKDRIEGNYEQTSTKTFYKDRDSVDNPNNIAIEPDDEKLRLNDNQNYSRKVDKNGNLKCREIKTVKGQVKSRDMAPNDTGKVRVKDSIRDSFTPLLDGIDLMDLCDHLYQNSVLDMEKYRSLFEMSFARVNDRNAKRMLLLYLSEREVHKENLLKSLNESAHYPLIPYFFPTYYDTYM